MKPSTDWDSPIRWEPDSELCAYCEDDAQVIVAHIASDWLNTGDTVGMFGDIVDPTPMCHRHATEYVMHVSAPDGYGYGGPIHQARVTVADDPCFPRGAAAIVRFYDDPRLGELAVAESTVGDWMNNA